MTLTNIQTSQLHIKDSTRMNPEEQMEETEFDVEERLIGASLDCLKKNTSAKAPLQEWIIRDQFDFLEPFVG